MISGLCDQPRKAGGHAKDQAHARRSMLNDARLIVAVSAPIIVTARSSAVLTSERDESGSRIQAATRSAVNTWRLAFSNCCGEHAGSATQLELSESTSGRMVFVAADRAPHAGAFICTRRSHRASAARPRRRQAHKICHVRRAATNMSCATNLGQSCRLHNVMSEIPSRCLSSLYARYRKM